MNGWWKSVLCYAIPLTRCYKWIVWSHTVTDNPFMTQLTFCPCPSDIDTTSFLTLSLPYPPNRILPF